MKTRVSKKFRYVLLPVLFLLLYGLQQRFPAMHEQGALWSDRPRWWQFFTCNFLSGNGLHLAMNMFSMALLHIRLGPRIRLPVILILFTLFAAVSTWAYYLLIMPENVWVVGASGGGYALFGFLGWFLRRFHVDWCGLRPLALPVLLCLPLCIILEALVALLWIPQLAWPLHAVAVSFGLLFALVFQAIYAVCHQGRAIHTMICALELREPLPAMEENNECKI